MSKLTIALFVAAGLASAGPAAAQISAPKTTSTPMSKDSYNTAKQNADAQYKIDKDACSSLKANVKDICVAQAKGKDNVAKADAQAAYENTPKARESARVVRAQAVYDVANKEAAMKQAVASKDATADKRDAEYKVAVEKCDALAGTPKDSCVSNAKTQFGKT